MIFSPQRDLVIRASKSQDYRIKHIANPVITTNTIPKKEKQTMKKDKTKKTERIFLRLSPSEKKVIQENALTTGMNISDYIRESVLQKFPQSSVPTINVLEVITHAQNICNLAKSSPYDNKTKLENEVKKLWQILQ